MVGGCEDRLTSGEVDVGIGEARHQSAARRVDHHGVGDRLPARPSDPCDPTVLDEDILAGGLEAAKTWIRESIDAQRDLADQWLAALGLARYSGESFDAQ